MKTALWITFSIGAALWTLAAWFSASMLEAALPWLQGADVRQAGQVLTEWPVPPWASVWLDPALLRSAQAALAWLLDSLVAAGPAWQTLTAWLVPAVWTLWGLGLVVALVLAALAHAVINTYGPGRKPLRFKAELLR